MLKLACQKRKRENFLQLSRYHLAKVMKAAGLLLTENGRCKEAGSFLTLPLTNLKLIKIISYVD